MTISQHIYKGMIAVSLFAAALSSAQAANTNDQVMSFQNIQPKHSITDVAKAKCGLQIDTSVVQALQKNTNTKAYTYYMDHMQPLTSELKDLCYAVGKVVVEKDPVKADNYAKMVEAEIVLSIAREANQMDELIREKSEDMANKMHKEGNANIDQVAKLLGMSTYDLETVIDDSLGTGHTKHDFRLKQDVSQTISSTDGPSM